MATTPADRASLQAKIDQYHWFHSIDFGNGLASRGDKTPDYIAQECKTIIGPIVFHGSSVLDVGTFNGFYAFEAKRRGAASVVATDTWSWRDPHRRARETFDLGRSLLNLDVRPVEIDPAEISPALGVFDIVFFFGVFYHLIEPIFCTRRLATCAKRLMIIETHIDAMSVDRPAMIFYPGAEVNNDDSNWWGPNPHLMFELMTGCGFARIFFRENSVHGRRGVFYCFRSQADADQLLAGPLPPAWHDLNDAKVRTRVFAAERTPS